jgi:glycosyltransferase involved in cell wall biosynthesis
MSIEDIVKPAMADNISLCAICIVRNEADIIVPFLNQLSHLFDRILLVDVQSTDGTKELIEEFSKTWPNCNLYTCETAGQRQSAIMNELARKAAGEGVDWIFFLDADEFVNVENKAALHKYLQEFPHDVMDMHWINLVPSVYGRFDLFDWKQKFFWSGRVSPITKVAVSSLYISANPEFQVSEGNHAVVRRLGEPPITKKLGLTLLHVPVRSADRLRYTLQSGLKLLGSVPKVSKFAADGVEPENLDVVAANYGVNDDDVESLKPHELGWPTKALPDYVVIPEVVSITAERLGETLMRDAATEWKKPSFVEGSPIRALITGSDIRIVSQPMSGDGSLVRDRYDALPKANPNLPEDIGLAQLVESVSASFLRPQVLRPSGWSNLVPALFAMFALLRPRRYAELGVHNGMSFFAACQVAEHLKLKTQCVAVDSWIGDPHATFHSAEVFDQFRATLKEYHPGQHYIRGFFLDARECFADESIDLLHVDGYHTYGAVKEDFESWLPKMSQTGVIIFHDTNVHERDFGVWRFWDNLKTRYPAFAFAHAHGLGIVCVGRQDSSVAHIFRTLHSNGNYGTLAQLFFQSLGDLAIEHRTLVEEIKRVKDNSSQEISALVVERDAKFNKLHGEVAEREKKLNELHRDLRETEQKFLGLWQNNFDKSNPAQRRKEDCSIIDGSGLFDGEFYLAMNEDVRKAKCDAIYHYVHNGVREFRNPNKYFNTARYLLTNSDVSATGINPFVHYILYGRDENRAP